jgi:tRNA threonylcarbamoyladenosine biosynthesis protein TsaB
VEAVAVGVGPGLFTGLRVGVATAQAMALALDVPVVGMATLDLVAHRVRVSRGPILVAMDARRGELFWAPYEPVPGGTPRRLGPDRADPPARVAAAALELGPAVVVVGDGPERYPAVFGAVGLELVGGPDGLPSAVAAVELGARALAEGRGGPAGSVVPTYVRPPDAVASWPERAPRPQPATPAPADPVELTAGVASPVVGGGRRRSA